MKADPDQQVAGESEPLRSAFAKLQHDLDVARPTLDALLQRRPKPTRSPRWPGWLPLAAVALLLVWLSYRNHSGPDQRLPTFASTLQWSAPSDAFGPALPGSADWMADSAKVWAPDFTSDGASQ